jgi:chemotaxis protein histidine kinase CheA
LAIASGQVSDEGRGIDAAMVRRKLLKRVDVRTELAALTDEPTIDLSSSRF